MTRLAFVAALAVLAFPAVASAHATLRSTTPSFRAELQRSPRTIALHFDQKVELLQGAVRVLDDQGKDYALG
jgi:methionine-rich copper-binding protein CopC